MKQPLFFLFFLFLSSSVTITSASKEEKQQFITNYFLVKELIKMYNTDNFSIDELKIEKAKIACSQCNKTITCSYLWLHSITNAHESILNQLMDYFHTKSTQELSLFTLTTSQKLQIPCPTCSQYHGYYIANQTSS